MSLLDLRFLFHREIRSGIRFLLINIHIYSTKSRQVSPFILPDTNILFSIKVYLTGKICLLLQVSPTGPLLFLLKADLSRIMVYTPEKPYSFPVAGTYVPKAVCVIVFSISFFSSSGIPFIPTSRKPLMIIPIASSSVSPLAIRYSTWSLAIFPTAAS